MFIRKKSFALFITIILVGIFAMLSISIVETKVISTNIDSLKYFHLQANIHLKYIKEFILTHTKEQINNFNLNDERFIVDIIRNKENNQSNYHIYIKTADGSTVRLYDNIIKLDF